MKTIPGYANYAITKDGKVWSKPRITPHGHKRKGRWLKSGICSNGYLGVVLHINSQKYSCSIHRLVLETYVGPCPEGMEACHNNGNRIDNLLGNLRWDTRSNNHQDAIQHGTHQSLHQSGEKAGQAKLTDRDVRMIIYMYRTGLFVQWKIAKIYNIVQQEISRIVNRKRWKHIWQSTILI